MELSVIVPVYKAEKYLYKCVDSILNQSFSDFELILVDDGSPDKSGNICDEYAKKDSRVKVIHKENGGVSAARNAGLDNATGKYIIFVDSDDWIADDALMSLLAPSLEKYDMVLSSIEMIEKNGKKVSYGMCKNEYTAKELLSSYMKSEIPKLCFNGPVAKRFRRDIIEKAALRFRDGMSSGEDELFNLQYLSRATNACGIDIITYYYNRDNTESLFSSFQKTTFEQQRTVFSYALKCAEQLGCEDDAVNQYKNEYLSHNVVACVIKGARAGDKGKYLYCVQKVSEDEYFNAEIDRIKNKKAHYVMAKLIQHKKFNCVYYANRVYYRLKRVALWKK